MNEQTHRPFPLPLAAMLFVASGACGLAYEVVWARELVLVFGASALASSAVLAGFMGGLGIGGILGGRRADGLARPLRVYGLLELAVGGLGLLSADFFRTLVRGAFRLIATGAGIEGDLGRDLLRLLLTLLVLLPPTVLMGATFPAMAAAVCRGADGPTRGRRIASIYAANLVGAVAGTFAAGLFLLPAVGVRLTLVLTALLNIAIGVYCLLRDRAATASDATADTPAPEPAAAAPAEAAVETAPIGVLCGLASLGGARSLALQVVWARVLGLILGSSVYAITTVLGTILAGLGLGAAVSSRLLLRTRRPLATLAVVETLALGAIIGSSLAFPELPWLFIAAFRRFADPLDGGASIQAIQVLLCALVVLGPAFLMGLSTPILMGAASAGEPDEAAGRATAIYVASTFGAIAGALAGGFVLLRWLGLRGALLAATAPTALMAAWLLVRMLPRPSPARITPLRRRVDVAIGVAGAPTLAAMMLIVASLLVPTWDPALLSAGTWTYVGTLPNLDTLTREAFVKQYRDREFELRFHQEGLVATVTVEDYEKNNARYLKSAGKVEAGVPLQAGKPSFADMPTQVMLSALPLLLAERPERVLVIGLGSGVTAGAALSFDEVKRLECVELEPAVVAAVRTGLFDEWNGRPFADERFACVSGEDGRNHILLADEPWDVIISQPSNPWLSGAANLFTREFFAEGRAALADGGLFCQWVQIDTIDPAAFRSIVATFCEVFEGVHLFRPPGTLEVLLLGAKGPLALDVARLEERGAGVGALLTTIGLRAPLDLLATHVLGDQELRAAGGGAPINTDDNLYVEFAAPRGLGIGTDAAKGILEGLLARARRGPTDALAGLPEDPAARSATVRRLAEATARLGNVDGAVALATALGEGGDDPEALRLLGDLEHLRGREEEAIAAWEGALAIADGHVPTLISLATYRFRRGEDARARELLDEAVAKNPGDQRALYFRGRLRLQMGDLEGARGDLEAAGDFADAEDITTQLEAASPERDPKRAPRPRTGPSVKDLRRLGAQALRRGEINVAVSAFEQVLIQAGPDDARARADLGAALAARPRMTPARFGRARGLLEEAIAIDPADAKARLALGKLLHDHAGEDEPLLGAAREALRAYFALTPRSSATARASLMLADVLRRLGRIPDAIAELEQARDMAPDYPTIALNLGGLYALADRREEARAELLRFRQIAPPNAPELAEVERWLRENPD